VHYITESYYFVREFWEIKESQATKELLVLTVRMVVTGLMVNPVTMERTGLKGKLELLAIRYSPYLTYSPQQFKTAHSHGD
jgi:hypothetical protein